MAQAAIEQLDNSGDGQIDQRELAAAPGLAEAFPVLDTDNSGTLSAAEVSARLELFEKLRTAYVDTVIVINVNGRPLRDAFVKLVPEGFQGTALSPATGMTDYAGKVSPQTVGSAFTGVQPGFYRVELYQDEAGTKPIAVKKPLGIEASGTSRPDRDLVAVLKFEAGG